MILIKDLLIRIKELPADAMDALLLAMPNSVRPKEGLIKFFENLSVNWVSVGWCVKDIKGRTFPPIALGTPELLVVGSVLAHLEIN